MFKKAESSSEAFFLSEARHKPRDFLRRKLNQKNKSKKLKIQNYTCNKL